VVVKQATDLSSYEMGGGEPWISSLFWDILNYASFFSVFFSRYFATVHLSWSF
jgi:hypothetical protein